MERLGVLDPRTVQLIRKDGACNLPDTMLGIAVDRWPDRSAFYEELEAELLGRADDGNMVCQRQVLNILRDRLHSRRMPVSIYLQRAEPYARRLAECGGQEERVCLAGWLLVKAAFVADWEGFSEIALGATEEAMTILARLINEDGRDDLVEAYRTIMRELPPDGRESVQLAVSIDGLMLEPKAEPEVGQALQRFRPSPGATLH